KFVESGNSTSGPFVPDGDLDAVPHAMHQWERAAEGNGTTAVVVGNDDDLIGFVHAEPPSTFLDTPTMDDLRRQRITRDPDIEERASVVVPDGDAYAR